MFFLPTKLVSVVIYFPLLTSVTLDIGLHEVRVGVSVRYVITKFSRMDSLPNFLTHGALLARFARESSSNNAPYASVNLR